VEQGRASGTELLLHHHPILIGWVVVVEQNFNKTKVEQIGSDSGVQRD
jgi:hypothetical protein